MGHELYPFLAFLVADTRLCTLPCWSIRPSVTFLNFVQFLHYCSCPTVRDWIAVYPALFFFHLFVPLPCPPSFPSLCPPSIKSIASTPSVTLYRASLTLSHFLPTSPLSCFFGASVNFFFANIKFFATISQDLRPKAEDRRRRKAWEGEG